MARRPGSFPDADAATSALTSATKEWKAAKKAERAARDRLATVVTDARAGEGACAASGRAVRTATTGIRRFMAALVRSATPAGNMPR